MHSIYYQSTVYWVLFVDIIVALATLWLYKSGGASRRTLVIVAGAFVAGIVFMHWGFGGQNFLPADLAGGWYYALILGGAALVLLILQLTSAQIFDQLTQKHLQLAQGLRVFIGGGFLMEGVLQVIPGWFSIMDGFFHIASGFLALVAALAFSMNFPSQRKWLWAANLVGLTDIMVIVTSICFLVWGELGPHHNMNYVVFGAGPILLWIHLNSIKKLIQSAQPASPSLHA